VLTGSAMGSALPLRFQQGAAVRARVRVYYARGSVPTTLSVDGAGATAGGKLCGAALDSSQLDSGTA
jgi:hypothetical protein